MLFSDGSPGSRGLTLVEALAPPFPASSALLAPQDEADLRPLVFGPALDFPMTAARAAELLFPECLDSESAMRLARRAFREEPPMHRIDEDLVGVDLCTGPTGDSSDYVNRFVTALLEGQDFWGSSCGISALSGPEISSLALALASSGRPLIALCGEEGLRDLNPSCLEREGGRVRLVGVRGGAEAAWRLERESTRGSDGAPRLVSLGAGSPARFAGRSIFFASLLVKALRGQSGELYAVTPREDPEAIAIALWVWSWGIPLTGVIVPEWSLPEADLGGAPPPGSRASLLERFASGRPVSSLIQRVPIGREELFEALADPSGWCDHGDECSISALAAARRAIADGLAGHARIIVPRFSKASDSGGDARRDPFEPSRPVRPDVTIDADIVSLRAMLVENPIA